MKVIQCDGCGCTYPINGENFVVRVIKNNAYKTVSEKFYDVCPKCLKHIGVWIPPLKEDFLPEEETDV